MAHQCDIIPWQRLIDILEPSFHPSGSKSLSDLVFRKDTESKREEALADFVCKFVQAIQDQTKVIQTRYPRASDDVAGDEIVISDEVLKRTMPTIERWASLESPDDWKEPEEEVQERYAAICAAGEGNTSKARECLVPLHRRKMKAFFLRRQGNDCYNFEEINGKAHFQVKLVESLLLHGEMETLLKICYHDNVHYHEWMCFRNCYCTSKDSGWDDLYRRALKAYIALNILLAASASQSKPSSSKNQQSYRDLSCYQELLAQCLDYSGNSNIPRYLHSDFWGFDVNRKLGKGKVNRTFKQFMAINCNTRSKRIHLPPVNVDVDRIHYMLRRKGLPTELATEIMQLAEFIGRPGSKLTVPHDPFHVLNKKALLEYLEQCWQIIVRCNVMCEALDRPATWDTTNDESDDEYDERGDRWPEWDKMVQYSLYSISKEIYEHFENRPQNIPE